MAFGWFEFDRGVKLASFDFLTRRTHLTSDGVLPRTTLAGGFTFEGGRVLLLGPRRRFSRREAGGTRVWRER